MYSLPKSRILRGRKRFAEIFNSGARQSHGPLLLIYLPNELPHHRIGIVMPKRIGPAVRRNRVRRQLREVFRQIQHDFSPSHDLLLIIRPHATARVKDYRQHLSFLLSKATESPKISP